MEPIPAYNKLPVDQHLFLELKRSVFKKVSDLGNSRMKWVRTKAIILPVLYIALYSVSLQQQRHMGLYYSLYAGMGVTIVLIFVNIIHEASHQVLFKDKRLNRLCLLIFDLIGANSYIWKLRHTRLHHNFSNVAGWDSDIQQSGMFKVFPADETKKFHRYQHLLVFFVYPLYLLNWLFVRDFKDFFLKSQLVHKICRIPFIEHLKLFFFKSFFLFYIVFLPALYFDFPLGQTVTAMFIMLITAGVFALIVLLPPHANIENEFPIVKDGNLPDSWLTHQFATTNDVTPGNWFTMYCMGNFNYHLAHHLFPNISYAYAEEVTAIIKEHAARNGLLYKAYPLTVALKNHYLLLKKNGMDKDFFEHEM